MEHLSLTTLTTMLHSIQPLATTLWQTPYYWNLSPCSHFSLYKLCTGTTFFRWILET